MSIITPFIFVQIKKLSKAVKTGDVANSHEKKDASDVSIALKTFLFLISKFLNNLF